MATIVATDAFDKQAGYTSDLSSYSTDWSLITGFVPVSSDSYAYPGGGQHSLHIWISDSFDTDQYAEITFLATTNGAFIGPAVRLTAGQDQGYDIYTDCDAQYMHRIDAGVRTTLASAGTDGVAGPDTLYLEMNNTTLTPKHNGTVINPPGAQTDATYATGSPGIIAYGNTQNHQANSWEAGNLAAAAGEDYLPSIAHRHLMTLRGN